MDKVMIIISLSLYLSPSAMVSEFILAPQARWAGEMWLVETSKAWHKICPGLANTVKTNKHLGMPNFESLNVVPSEFQYFQY